jgi:hypothetical protein
MKTLRLRLYLGLASLLAGVMAAAAFAVAGFFIYHLFQPVGRCGVVGCWEGLAGAGIGALIGAIAGPVVSWRYLASRFRRP